MHTGFLPTEFLSFLINKFLPNLIMLDIPWLAGHNSSISWSDNSNTCVSLPCHTTHTKERALWSRRIFCSFSRPSRYGIVPLASSLTSFPDVEKHTLWQSEALALEYPCNYPTSTDFFMEKRWGGGSPGIKYRGPKCGHYKIHILLTSADIRNLASARCTTFYWAKLAQWIQWLVNQRVDEWKIELITMSGQYENMMITNGLVNVPSVFRVFVEKGTPQILEWCCNCVHWLHSQCFVLSTGTCESCKSGPYQAL